MPESQLNGQFAEELSELHDGSISLFVTLPVFRGLLVSRTHADALRRFETDLAVHLAQLDGIIGDVLIRRDRSDGDLTQSLFRSLALVRQRGASPSRDGEIIAVVQQALVFLMGSCGFALRFARQAGVDRSVQVLGESLRLIGTLALPFAGSRLSADVRVEWSDAVA